MGNKDSEAEIPDLAGLPASVAQWLAYDTGRWMLANHATKHGRLEGKDWLMTVRANCPDNLPGGKKATGGDLGVILDVDPTQHAAGGRPGAASVAKVPDFAKARDAVEAQLMADRAGFGWLFAHDEQTGRHSPIRDWNVHVSNCCHNAAGAERNTGGDLGVVLDVRVEWRQFLLRLLPALLGGLVGGATGAFVAKLAHLI